jgi:hypothetical protein
VLTFQYVKKFSRRTEAGNFLELEISGFPTKDGLKSDDWIIGNCDVLPDTEVRV